MIVERGLERKYVRVTHFAFNIIPVNYSKCHLVFFWFARLSQAIFSFFFSSGTNEERNLVRKCLLGKRISEA